jgi:uncharacterized membrane protein
MFENIQLALTFLSAIGCGLIGGVFFAFSTFVMKGLNRLPAPTGIAAMQSIDIVAVSPMFMTALFGTGVACLALVILSLFGWDQPGAGCLIAGGSFYLVGSILVTIIFNVPRNQALAVVDPASTEGAEVWAGYVPGWTAWNTVRTVTSLAASACMIVGLSIMVAQR